MENNTEKKGGKKIRLIIIGLVALLIVGAGAYFGYTKFIKDKGTEKAAAATIKTTQTAQVAQTQGQQTAQNQTYLQQIV